MPREAFELVGCMDKRFRGWGGEDVSFLRSLDTLYTPHKNTPADVLHLWHPRPGGQDWSKRMWEGQKKPRANEWLASQYNRATGKPEQMRRLVDEGCDEPEESETDLLLRLGAWAWQELVDLGGWFVRLIRWR
jgi:predicted glycosyltransferase involved in capsule biosynthesis